MLPVALAVPRYLGFKFAAESSCIHTEGMSV